MQSFIALILLLGPPIGLWLYRQRQVHRRERETYLQHVRSISLTDIWTHLKALNPVPCQMVEEIPSWTDNATVAQRVLYDVLQVCIKDKEVSGLIRVGPYWLEFIQEEVEEMGTGRMHFDSLLYVADGRPMYTTVDTPSGPIRAPIRDHARDVFISFRFDGQTLIEWDEDIDLNEAQEAVIEQIARWFHKRLEQALEVRMETNLAPD